MDWDEPRKPKGRDIVVGEPLAALSIDELEARVGALGDELERVKAEIARKRHGLVDADKLFKR